jgi:hypothetical protein
MLSHATVREIVRLLDAAELSQRAIARRLRVSRGIVWRVAHRLRPIGYDDGTPRKPPVRCPTCGGLVYLPCVLCRARERQQQRRATKPRRAA